MPCPLNQNHYTTVNDGLRKIAETVPAMDDAERAGIDQTENRIMSEHLRQRLIKIKEVYFPNKP